MLIIYSIVRGKDFGLTDNRSLLYYYRKDLHKGRTYGQNQDLEVVIELNNVVYSSIPQAERGVRTDVLNPHDI